MDNNLSELSKPIGVSFKSDIELMKSGRMIHGQMTVWKSRVGIPDSQEGVYSQECVSALLADNERLASDLVARNGEIEGLRERAAELESYNVRLREWNAGLAQESCELKAKLATPVRLPDSRQCVSGDRYQWSDGVHNYRQDTISTLREQGFTVGDE